jgi:hypothetical protein
MKFSLLFLGIISAAAGYSLKYYVEKKKFDRRNSAGIEEFESFGKSVIAGAYEGFLLKTGFALMFLGLGISLVSFV